MPMETTTLPTSETQVRIQQFKLGVNWYADGIWESGAFGAQHSKFHGRSEEPAGRMPALPVIVGTGAHPGFSEVIGKLALISA